MCCIILFAVCCIILRICCVFCVKAAGCCWLDPVCIFSHLVITGFVVTPLFKCLIGFVTALFLGLMFVIIGSLNVHLIIGVVSSVAGQSWHEEIASEGRGLQQ